VGARSLDRSSRRSGEGSPRRPRIARALPIAPVAAAQDALPPDMPTPFRSQTRRLTHFRRHPTSTAPRSGYRRRSKPPEGAPNHLREGAPCPDARASAASSIPIRSKLHNPCMKYLGNVSSRVNSPPSSRVLN